MTVLNRREYLRQPVGRSPVNEAIDGVLRAMPIGGARSGILGAAGAGDAIPASVDYQYPVSTFGTSTWSDNAGSADMTVNNLTASTFSNGEDSVAGDGTDDYGVVNNGPRDLPQNQTFGVALTLQYGAVSSGTLRFFGATDGSVANRFQLYNGNFFSGSYGELIFEVSDSNDNRIIEETNSAYDDGTPHAVVANKTSNSNWDIYVDDMTSTVATTTQVDEGFDHTNFSPSYSELAFYALADQGSIISYYSYDAGIFEFNTAPYTQSEREDFVSRRPEV